MLKKKRLVIVYKYYYYYVSGKTSKCRLLVTRIGKYTSCMYYKHLGFRAFTSNS